MAAGGFDVVIGNPPYVRQEMLGRSKSYFEQHYESYQGTADLYVYFIEKSLRLLNKGGRYGIIVSRSFLHTTFATKLRRYIRENSAILGFVDFGGLAVFENAKDTYVCIPLLANRPQPEVVELTEIKSLEMLDLEQYVEENKYLVPPNRFSEDAWLLKSQEHIDLFHKICRIGVPLGEFVPEGIYSGIKTGLNIAFLIDHDTKDALISKSPNSIELIHPFYGGMDIRRYFVRSERYLIAIPNGWTRDRIVESSGRSARISEAGAWRWLSTNYRAVSEHLEPFAEKAQQRQDQGEFWWELRPCAYYHILSGRKIIYPDITKWPRFYLDENGAYISNTAYCLGTDDLYLLGILNSRLFWFAIGNISIPFGTRAGKYRYRLIYQYMEQVPIRAINFDDPADIAQHDNMVALVERMLDVHKKLAAATIPADKTLYQRQIEATDRQIEALVYELYGLTEEEIAVVEGRSRG
nr:Eco57I restriction-modification methylase domain-containing protein [Chloroflexota bacterium]